MATFNKVILVGNVTRDPEVRYTSDGKAVASFSFAVNTPMGKDKADTMFIDVVSFGKLAEVIKDYVKKGSPLLLDGRLRYRTWEDNNGNKRSKHEILLQNMQFLGGKKDSSDSSAVETPEVPPSEFNDEIPF